MTLAGFERQDAASAYFYLKMMFRDKYIGSSLGVFWAISSPVLMLAIFTFVFGFVFRAKLPGAETSLSYVIWLISGYGPWLSISEGLMSAASAVVSGGAMIKNIKMKPELLSIAGSAMGLVPLAVALVYVIVLLTANGDSPSASWLVIPIILIIQFVMFTGIGFFLSALSVFWRDIIHVLPNFLMMVMFATPIFYPIEAMHGVVRRFSLFNPIYLLSEWYRQPLLNHSLPPLWTLAYIIVFAILSFYLGLLVFRRLRPFFESSL